MLLSDASRSSDRQLGHYSKMGLRPDCARHSRDPIPIAKRGRRNYHSPHMPSILYKLRGIEKWPSATATVTSSEVVSSGGRSGRTMNVLFTFLTGSGTQEGKVFVDDNSSLYGLSEGEQFTLQYNPANPSSFYCEAASSLSRTIRRTIVVVGVLFAITVFLIEFFGR